MALSVWVLAIACRIAKNIRDSDVSLYWAFGIWSGLAVYAHLFIAGPVLVVCTGALAYLMPKNARVWASFLLALLIGSPSWVPAALGFFMQPETGLSNVEVIRALQFRHPHHHQPWTWPLGDWFQWTAILASSVYAFYRMRAAVGKPITVPAALLGWFVITCAGFVLFGLMERLPIMAYLQPFRLFPLLWLFHAIAAVALLEAAVAHQSRYIFWCCFAILFLALRVMQLEGPLLVSIFLVLLAINHRSITDRSLSLLLHP